MWSFRAEKLSRHGEKTYIFCSKVFGSEEFLTRRAAWYHDRRAHMGEPHTERAFGGSRETATLPPAHKGSFGFCFSASLSLWSHLEVLRKVCSSWNLSVPTTFSGSSFESLLTCHCLFRLEYQDAALLVAKQTLHLLDYTLSIFMKSFKKNP